MPVKLGDKVYLAYSKPKINEGGAYIYGVYSSSKMAESVIEIVAKDSSTDYMVKEIDLDTFYDETILI